ncbi:MAG: sugar ABC transporter permease [Candidatus Hadarchaeales archaeon]
MKNMPERWFRKIVPYLFVIPALVFFIVFFIYPNIDVFRISFYEWDGIGPEKYTGISNFERLVKDSEFWSWKLWFISSLCGLAGAFIGVILASLRNRKFLRWGVFGFVLGLLGGILGGGIAGVPAGALERTLVIGIQSVFIQLPVALVIALILHGKIKGARIFATIVFLPVIISLVALALTWRYMIYDLRVGALNAALKIFGAKPINWLADLPLLSVVITTNWIYIGLYVVIFIAALRSIPSAIFDSAKVDGLSSFHVLRYIVIPHIKKVILLTIIMCISGTFKAFDLLWVMTGAEASEVHITSTYLVKQMMYGYWGYACAIAVACFFISLAIVAVQLKLMRIKV